LDEVNFVFEYTVNAFGSLFDADGDGVADTDDVCADEDDTVDYDADEIPDCIDDEVIVAATEVASTAGGWTAGGGYVIRIETSPSKVLMMEDKIVSSIQSNVTASASHDAANSKTIVVATFKRPLPAAGNNILPPDTSLFSIDMNYGDNPVPYCAVVTVTKNDDDTTLIKSRGYNTCREEDEDNPRKIERGLDVEY